EVQDHRVVRNLLAMCYLYLGAYDTATALYEALLQEDSTDIYALCHYTLLLYNTKENEPTRLKVGNSIQKYVKVDGEWLYKLISYIESNDDYYQNLKVIWNSKAHIINDRIYLNEQSAIYLNNNKDTSFSFKNME
ncbi:lantibiotic dehydratase, partial [Staphylococcus aureus]|uniref:lantibiotic dehydratase n=1 Tax=Staphylococcus aureus TaxID=1280 RepID=UPI00210C76ED